jgi:hypothetical protein
MKVLHDETLQVHSCRGDRVDEAVPSGPINQIRPG